MPPALRSAPEWEIDSWLNAPEPLTLAGLRGKVVVTLAFQMLCHGCVASALPQMQRVRAFFPAERVAVVGLHTVFENHAAMGPAALARFLQEQGIGFPVGVDRPAAAGGVPETMRRYGMQGTPTLVLIDAAGRLRQQSFGHVADMALGAAVQALMMEDG